MKYYTQRQTKWRAFLAGLTFGVYPRDYPLADCTSSWRRIMHAIAHDQMETLP